VIFCDLDFISILGEETRVSVSGHTSRQVSTDMSQEYAELMAQDNVFQETMAPDEGSVILSNLHTHFSLSKEESVIQYAFPHHMELTLFSFTQDLPLKMCKT
jgi:hypothetical protein